MRINRIQRAKWNLLTGFGLKLYYIIIPFIIRTILIRYIGMEFLGLNGAFASVLQLLNLAELGIGNAMNYSMYDPIVRDDKKKICAILKLYRKYYIVIGCLIMVLGIMIIPVLPYLVEMDSIPDLINPYILYLIYLTGTACSYIFFSYRNSLWEVTQRKDVVNLVSFVSSLFIYAIQITVLLLWRNVYIYVSISVMGTLVNGLILFCMVKKKYPEFLPAGELDATEKAEIRKRTCDLFTSRFGGVIYDSADPIIIVAFLGVEVLAVYQNYFYIISALTGIMAIIYGSVMAGIGNSIVVETKDKNLKDFSVLSFIICWLGGNASAFLLCLFQPFMEMWVGRKLMLDYTAVICFAIYFYLRQINSVVNLYKDAAGMWALDKYRPITAGLFNLLMNIILVSYIGIYGVLLSTVLAILLVGMPWLIHNLFASVFPREKMKEYVLKLLKYSFITILGTIITVLTGMLIQGDLLLIFFVRAIICCILPNCIFWIMLRNDPEFFETVRLFDKLTNNKFNRITKLLTRDGKTNEGRGK